MGSTSEVIEFTAIPRVFISYSHDSKDHKQWVAEFAGRLRKNGIEVILDQWDLGLGDDIAKFMEVSIGTVDRVLVICTEQYVRKADDGMGGAGYEHMIVTGELIRKLGTNKFIPIFRQGSAGTLLPSALSTRFGVNLGEGADIEDAFLELLHRLHEIPPLSKPALGPSPFAKSFLTTDIEAGAPLSLPIEFGVISTNPAETYNQALAIARGKDITSWRRLIRSVMTPIPDHLAEWRKKYEAVMPTLETDLPSMAIEACNVYAPLFAVALAGVESGEEKFVRQLSVVDEILEPRGWNHAGSSLLADIPSTIAFVFQALHGSICVSTEQIGLAEDLARLKITTRFGGNSHSLIQRHDMIGWPGGLGGKSNLAWTFLLELPTQWPWLNEPFGDKSRFQIALLAYYEILSIIELTDFLKSENKGLLKVGKPMAIHIDVPLQFPLAGDEVCRKAHRALLAVRPEVREIWHRRNVSDAEMLAAWPAWSEVQEYWNSRAFPFFGWHVPFSTLLSDLLA